MSEGIGCVRGQQWAGAGQRTLMLAGGKEPDKKHRV